MINTYALTIDGEDYHLIPNFSNYAISRSGLVINLRNMCKINPYRRYDGYYSYGLKRDNGGRCTLGRHRALMLTFRHPGEIGDLQVNHIDGIPGSDHLDNLEWVTPRGNCEHAGEMQLSPKCLPILVRDVDTGDISSHPSIESYARSINVSKFAIQWRVQSRGQRVFPERKQYKLKHDDIDWLIPEDIEHALLFNTTEKPVLVKCLKTNTVKEYPKISDAAAALGIAVPTLSTRLDFPDQPVFPGLYQVKLKTDLTPWREIEDPILELERTYGTVRTTICLDTKTNILKVYEDSKACAIDHGLKPTALSYRLSLNTDKVWSDGKVYMYYTDFVQKKKSLSCVQVTV